LICRTIRQIDKMDTVVVAPEVFREYVGVLVTTIGYRDGQERPLLDGILKTQDFWGDERTVILLGDVVFSNKAIETIFELNYPYFIFGRNGSNQVTGKEAGELFAFSFSSGYYDRVIDKIEGLLKNNKKKLWDLLRSDRAIPLIQILGDYTDDTDSPQSYEQFWSKLENAAITDDNQERKMRSMRKDRIETDKNTK